MKMIRKRCYHDVCIETADYANDDGILPFLFLRKKKIGIRIPYHDKTLLGLQERRRL